MSIKHGKVYRFEGKAPSHLDPIREYVTKGWADARQSLTLELQRCDVNGAKRYNGQHCVVARALNRRFKPDAVAVGRSLAYVVIKGVAIRFGMSGGARQVAEEFDQRGRSHLCPIHLLAPNRAQRLDVDRHTGINRNIRKSPRRRARKLGVRAIGGGIAS